MTSRALAVTLAFALAGCSSGGTDQPPAPSPAEPPAEKASVDDRRDERHRMVRLQLEARGVDDPRVLGAMRRVPRHELVPEEVRPSAYDDRPLPIGHQQTISQPFIVALMTQVLSPEPTDKVLEIGTGSGYQAAVLSLLVNHLFTIEIVEPLAARAVADLDRLGYRNVTVIVGDGYRGLPDEAPFDRIIVTAAPPRVPQPLIDQLAVGGRMVIPVGEGVQKLLLLEKFEDEVVTSNLLPVRFVPMTGEAQRRESGNR